MKNPVYEQIQERKVKARLRMLQHVACPQFPHTSYYDIRFADGVAG